MGEYSRQKILHICPVSCLLEKFRQILKNKNNKWRFAGSKLKTEIVAQNIELWAESSSAWSTCALRTKRNINRHMWILRKVLFDITLLNSHLFRLHQTKQIWRITMAFPCCCGSRYVWLHWAFVYVLSIRVVKGNGCEDAGSTVIYELKLIDIFNQYKCEKNYCFIVFILYFIR